LPEKGRHLVRGVTGQKDSLVRSAAPPIGDEAVERVHRRAIEKAPSGKCGASNPSIVDGSNICSAVSPGNNMNS
jgi:hypothetical protein